MPKLIKPAADAATPAINNAALEKIAAQFTEGRWTKIQRQASCSCALDATGLQSLCTRLLETRSVRHPDNAAAALYSACNGLLLAIGSSPNAHDASRYEEAVRTGKLVPLPTPPIAQAPAPVTATADTTEQPV